MIVVLKNWQAIAGGVDCQTRNATIDLQPEMNLLSEDFSLNLKLRRRDHAESR